MNAIETRQIEKEEESAFELSLANPSLTGIFGLKFSVFLVVLLVVFVSFNTALCFTFSVPLAQSSVLFLRYFLLAEW